ncbi:hypothetical protein [Parafrigoribacterium mesophilum]|uniref:hypothetical protein n=1 Tax=Parafrigoribacterium mesophilum TaxID=433646 RepID=UPI0031FBE6E5
MSSLATAPAGDAVRELQARIRQMQSTKLDSRSIPTPPAIGALLPDGALRQGAVYSLGPSAALLMALLAAPSVAGSWCGIVGIPEFGIEAAEGFGIDLDRLVLIPHPGEHWLGVTAAIADVMGVVATRPPGRTNGAAAARLSARLRQRGCTLLVLGPWPQSEAMLTLSDSDWTGIGSGFGHLTARQATVTVTGRAARPRSARVWLPDRDFRVGAAVPQTVPPETMPPEAGAVLSDAGHPRWPQEVAG